MTRRPLHPATYVGLGLLAGTLGTSGWLHAQDTDTRRPSAGAVYAGNDIAFRVVGRNGKTPIVLPVVKVNGEWVEVEFGGAGIRKLTQ